MRHPAPAFWFESLNRRLGMPRWASAVCIGWLPFLLLGLLTVPLLEASYFYTAIIPGSVLDLVLSLFTFYTVNYLRREVSGLVNKVDELKAETEQSPARLDLSALSSTRRVVLVYAVLLALTVPLFALGQTGTPLVTNIVSEIPFLWFNFVFATFLWAFGYSMYSIYGMGKLPLKLKPYTEDRTLGLRPFGKTSLNFTLIYLGVITAVVVPVIFGGAIPLGLALGFLMLYPIGFLLFLLPLMSCHSKLVDAKMNELAWIGPRATVLFQKVKSIDVGQLDQSTVNEVSVLDKIKRDVQQIHTWPFDTGIVARLFAILLSVSAILLSGIIRNLLHI